MFEIPAYQQAGGVIKRASSRFSKLSHNKIDNNILIGYFLKY